MEGPHEHLEHIEHQEHAAHSPFDKKVAMTMAIVAACLAAVTLASHRAHNETLQLQIEASIKQNEVTDEWGRYQAKKIRQYGYEAMAAESEFLAHDPSKEEKANSAIADWRKKAARYEGELKELEEKNKEKEGEVKSLIKRSELTHHQGDRFDLGELGIELSLVLCSVAVLTKRAAFWYSGMGVGFVGAVAALTAFWIGGH
jgi:hypothetical protein